MRKRALCAAAVGLVTALTGGVAHAAGGTQPSAAAAGAASVSTPVKEDFNGDGYQDLVVTAPDGTVSGRAGAGYVVVMYGSAAGVGAGSRTIVSQSTAGVPGAAEAGDRFGYKTVARDLDGDGLTDLAVHSQGESVDATVSHGTVTVLWGRAGGLTGEGAAVVQAPAGSTGWDVGGNLAAGDFNGDGRADLLMRHGTEWNLRSVLFGPFTRAGAPAGEQKADLSGGEEESLYAVTAGDMTGDGIDDLATFYSFEEMARGGKFWRGTTSGLSTTSTPLPSAVTGVVGDFDKDGKGDLAVRHMPNGVVEDIPYDAGTVKVYYGTSTGPSTTRVTTITQDTSGVPGAGERGDQFGARLDAGDVNGDGYADLVAGVPFEALGTKTAAGSVVLLKGGSGGLGGAGAQVFHQDTAGVPGVAEAGDRFGGAVRLLDVTGDGRAELAAASAHENGTGAVWVLRGTATGATATGAVAVNPADLGAPSAKARFGSAFANENSSYLYSDTL
ncbi:FG-GAP-like repeat-containing protein [Streptomyces sp. NPDC059506]|uniref:FG-GAP-like repeat-containing protein n=1 Tax=unclassified Streptomyces TaxID=2593676 RepID=UPI0015FB2E13|nr:FG-GAP-like repeat-containing protein [Streptomyces sp. SCUT-3]QMV22175.1 hypothetical protein GQS52_10675 [Streptomyces sp. SCUT-3]